jgi:hypothetical protein
MPVVVGFRRVPTEGLESSPVADALAGLRANEERKFARQESKLAGTIRGSFFVIKGEHQTLCAGGSRASSPASPAGPLRRLDGFQGRCGDSGACS